MLTYRALQSNSETIACNIAAYIFQHPVRVSGSGKNQTCSVEKSDIDAGVLIMPFDQNVVSSFQAWRADMALMSGLKKRTAKYCGKQDSSTPLQAEKGSTSAVPLSALGPAGDALSLAQSVLGSFATQTETSAVAGTIEDQALINGVAGQLRVLGVQALTPGNYAPDALDGTDFEDSPFLNAFQQTLVIRDCMVDAAAKNPNDKTLAEQLAELNQFFAIFTESATKPTADTTPNGGTGTGATGKTATQTFSSGKSLAEILMADGLARLLGISADGKLAPTSPWRHILFLKALESGGTITRTGNILGTHVGYSGGSVVTFALIARGGALECSGNVFEYGGKIASKHFEETYRELPPDLTSQLVFTRGSCAVR